MGRNNSDRGQSGQRAAHEDARVASLDLALDILRDESRWPDPADRLFEAICRRQGPIPTPVLRAFACDCAERALQHVRQAGLTPDPRCTRALEVQRRWLRGEATPEELAEAARAAKRAVYESDGEAWETVAYAVWAAMTLEDAQDDPVDSASCAYEYAAYVAQDSGQGDAQSENSWQVARLVELLQEQQHAGE